MDFLRKEFYNVMIKILTKNMLVLVKTKNPGRLISNIQWGPSRWFGICGFQHPGMDSPMVRKEHFNYIATMGGVQMRFWGVLRIGKYLLKYNMNFTSATIQSLQSIA